MAESDSNPKPYALGKTVSYLASPYSGQDLAFGSTRLDGSEIREANYSHCTFEDIGFKKAIFKRCTFHHCTFIGCYFRRAEIRDSLFVGCRFIDCQFSFVSITTSIFRYAIFRGCQIPFAELQHNFPSEPNIREELARSLFLESARLGLSSEASLYRMAEINAREENLRAAILCNSRWYKDHYDGWARIRALAQLVLSLINRWLWGYGERTWTLVRNVLIFALGVFPAVFYFLRDGLSKALGDSVSYLDLVYFSLANIVPAGVQSEIHAISLATRLWAGTEAVFGLVIMGLAASYIYRWSIHR